MTFALIAFQDLRSDHGTHFSQCWLWSPEVIYTHMKHQPLGKYHSANIVWRSCKVKAVLLCSGAVEAEQVGILQTPLPSCCQFVTLEPAWACFGFVIRRPFSSVLAPKSASFLKRRMPAHGAIVLSPAHSTLYLHSGLLSILLSKFQRVCSVSVEMTFCAESRDVAFG